MFISLNDFIWRALGWSKGRRLAHTFASILRFIPYVSRSSTLSVEEQKRIESELGEEVDNANIRIQEINKELDHVVEVLGEAKVFALCTVI